MSCYFLTYITCHLIPPSPCIVPASLKEKYVCIIWGIHNKIQTAQSCNFITWPPFLLTPSFSLLLQDPSIPCTTTDWSTIRYLWSCEQRKYSTEKLAFSISGSVINIENYLLSPSTLLLSAASACSLLLSAWWRMVRSLKNDPRKNKHFVCVPLPHFRAV